MSQYVLYAYHNGSDLNEVAGDLVLRLEQFVASREWKCENVKVVDQKHPPDWDLGLNFDLPDPGQEPVGWVADIDATAVFLGHLYSATGREFVIGAVNSTTGISEDLFYVLNGDPDLELLRRVIGTEPPTS